MTGFRKRTQRFSLAVAVGCLSALTALATSDGNGHVSGGIAADVNGEAITTEQLEEAMQGQIEQINHQLKQFKQSMLDQLINNLLLRQAARAEGMDANDYLRVKVESVTVSEEEVEEAYAKSQHRFPAMLKSEVTYRIRRQLEDNRRAEVLKRMLSQLRRTARVQNFLLERPPSDIDLQPQTGPSLGPSEARLTIVEFSDFECPFCRRIQPVLRRVLERWPQQVRLVYKHFPLDRHRNAFGASKAAVCADKQGHFWEFHDALYREDQDLSPQGVTSIAKSLGMEVEPFEACLQEEGTSAAVQEDLSLARRAGINGTPTLFVNGRRVSAASQLESEVEALLAVQPGGRGE